MYTADWCKFCAKAKALLEMNGITPLLWYVDNPAIKAGFIADGHKTIPQVYRNGELIGGYDSLVAYLYPPVQLELPLDQIES